MTEAKVVRTAEAVRGALQDASPERRKAYLKLFVDKVVISKEEICISGPKSALALAATRGLPDTTEGVIISLAQFPVAAGLAVLTPLIPFFLEMMALRRMDMGAFSILMSLEPAFGAIFGHLILRQILSAQQIIGIFAVMAASIGAVYLTSSKTTASTDVKIVVRGGGPVQRLNYRAT